ncbi:hypothetical protein ACP70R_022685 [Stipagrostis hirtigluma subsp. patula]
MRDTLLALKHAWPELVGQPSDYAKQMIENDRGDVKVEIKFLDQQDKSKFTDNRRVLIFIKRGDPKKKVAAEPIVG